jgi:hypothetical protein
VPPIPLFTTLIPVKVAFTKPLLTIPPENVLPITLIPIEAPLIVPLLLIDPAADAPVKPLAVTAAPAPTVTLPVLLTTNEVPPNKIHCVVTAEVTVVVPTMTGQPAAYKSTEAPTPNRAIAV